MLELVVRVADDPAEPEGRDERHAQQDAGEGDADPGEDPAGEAGLVAGVVEQVLLRRVAAAPQLVHGEAVQDVLAEGPGEPAGTDEGELGERGADEVHQASR